MSRLEWFHWLWCRFLYRAWPWWSQCGAHTGFDTGEFRGYSYCMKHEGHMGAHRTSDDELF